MLLRACFPHRSARPPRLTLLLAGLLPGLAAANEYFVRPTGDDSAAGDAPRHAWRTIARVNAQSLQPGDRVLFEGGKSFAGCLRLAAEDAGRLGTPVTIGSFGRGRATLLASGEGGITLENAGGITIRDLVIVGSGPASNTNHGVLCDNTLTNGSRLQGLRLERLEVRGFGRFGVLITGAPSGFEHVRVEGCVLRDNRRGGMEIAGRLPWDATHYAHANVQVRDCQAFDNTGDPDYARNHSGSGIVLYQVDGGLIERCAAWNNGALCGSAGGGPVGLWTCASRRVVIQQCESFANRTRGADGGGFDLDGGCEECVLQYNFSHDNDGPGLMAYTYPYASYHDRDNVIRFNLSLNDARKGSRYAGLWVRSDGGRMTGLQIYNNTVIASAPTAQAVSVRGQNVEAALRNNLFVAHGETTLLRVEEPNSALRFEHNLYWRGGRPFDVAWGAARYGTLEDWRAGTGQESLDGVDVGRFANPGWKVVPPEVATEPGLDFARLSAYRPAYTSGALNAGLNQRARFGLEVGRRDLLGSPISLYGPFPIGAIAVAR